MNKFSIHTRVRVRVRAIVVRPKYVRLADITSKKSNFREFYVRWTIITSVKISIDGRFYFLCFIGFSPKTKNYVHEKCVSDVYASLVFVFKSET